MMAHGNSSELIATFWKLDATGGNDVAQFTHDLLLNFVTLCFQADKIFLFLFTFILFYTLYVGKHIQLNTSIPEPNISR